MAELPDLLSGMFLMLRGEYLQYCDGPTDALVLSYCGYLVRREVGAIFRPPTEAMARALKMDWRALKASLGRLIERRFLQAVTGGEGRYRRAQAYTFHPPDIAGIPQQQPVENAVSFPGETQEIAPMANSSFPGDPQENTPAIPWGSPGNTAPVSWVSPGNTGRYKETEIDPEVDSESITIRTASDCELPPTKHSPHPISRLSADRKTTPTKAERQAAAEYGEEVRRAVRSKLAKFARYRREDGSHGAAVQAGDPDLIDKILAAANGADPEALTDWLSDRYEYTLRRPDQRPRGPGWFVAVVAEHFAARPPRVPPGYAEEGTRGAAQTACVAVNGPGDIRGGLPPPADAAWGRDLISELARKVKF